ncbi:tyrosine phosphatase family protein [Segnochrobactrum spirostomi]|uniref:Protein tyrosine phosphatase n=1 Tax=Segnochrobactrum spirostomi TaxID=2608987 RepID=A0A6A7Y6S3_9HYPH|nr:protein-tyrosine phosphatase family protein [Segnochrobactrum spirostomi]MQT14007.1 protein tyrosine phosphatase [Segnochrobactrum spirostomi]
MIHVCSLARLHSTVKTTGARHIVTLINADTPVERPQSVAAADHLFLGFNDIIEPMEGMTPPAPEHVEALLGFVGRWERTSPIVIHCFAGISRSTAAAFITACALTPERDEAEIANRLRAASPSATPNALLVRYADEQLGRNGRMVRAIDAIGRGRTAFEGTPFRLDIA